MIRFFVPGIPRPGGSKTAFRTKRGKVVVTDASKYTKNWQSVVALTAHEAMIGRHIYNEPLSLRIIFYMPRSKSHYGSGSNAEKLRPAAPKYHTIAPDITKLIRSTEDAMTRIVWVDDSQITKQVAEKVYSETPGAWIDVESMPEYEQRKISRIRTIAR